MNGAESSFAERLDLCLKALSIGRSRLAADLRVDKSLVTRWLNGSTRPAPHNLEAISRLFASHCPGFTMLDWQADLDALARRLGLERDDRPPVQLSLHGAGPVLPQLAASRERILQHGASWAGHWWGYRQTFRNYDQLVRDVIRISPRGDYLAFEWTHDVVHGEGWFLPGDGKGFALLPHRWADIPAFFTFFIMDGKPMQVIDGLVSTITIDASRDMIVAPYVMVRFSDLLSDLDDDARFATARAPDDWTVDPAALPPDIVARLMPTVSNGVMRIASATSIARFSTAGERSKNALRRDQVEPNSF